VLANVVVIVDASSVILREYNCMKKYDLDAADDHRTPLAGLFEAEAMPVIQRVSEGHNGTSFTYGVTSKMNSSTLPTS
jgi:hypothetical protein